MRHKPAREPDKIMRPTHSKTIKFSLFIVALLCSVLLSAQERTFNFEITPYGAYRVGGEFDEQNSVTSIDIDDSESYGFIFNARHSPVTQWEIIYSRQETTANAAGLGLSSPSPDLTIEYHARVRQRHVLFLFAWTRITYQSKQTPGAEARGAWFRHITRCGFGSLLPVRAV